MKLNYEVIVLKKFISLFLSAVLLLSIFAADGYDLMSFRAYAVDPASGTFSDSLTWSYNEATNTLKIGGTGAMNTDYSDRPWSSFSSQIKTVIINTGVTSIGDYAFRDCTGLTRITIPGSVTSIGYSAFYNSTGLTSVTIPNSVTSIGSEVFRNCTGLTSVTIPNSVTSIGYSAFYNCTGLTSVTIPNSVTSIGYSAFYGCTGLSSVTIPGSVTSISSSVFSECDGLESVVLGNGITAIEESAFYRCSSLTSITIPGSVTSIGDYAFAYCTGLSSVTIPNSVSSLGYCAFDGRTGLTSITIPNSVTSIGSEAFRDCTGLTSITIPDSVFSIGVLAFYNTGFYNDQSKWDKGVLYIGNHLIDSKWDEITGDYSVREGTVSIASGAFCPFFHSIDDINALLSHTGITSLTIPQSVKGIGMFSFLCKDLKTVYYNAQNCDLSACRDNGYLFEKGVYFAPFALSAVETFYIGEQVKNVPQKLLEDCFFLDRVYFPDSAVSLNMPLFGSFDNLDNDYVELYNELFSELYGLNYIPVSKPEIYCHSASYAYTFAEANGLDYILYEDNGPAFAIKNGVLTAYEGETENIVLPSGVSVVGSGAFKGNSGLKNAEIPYGISLIGSEAFKDCRSLESVTIPFTVTTIGKNAFEGTTASINCFYNSYAHKYALENNIPYNLIKVDFAQESRTMSVSQTASLGAAPGVPLASGLPMVFSSSDPDVVSVDTEGNVTALSPGKVKILVHTETGNFLGSCSVTVEPEGPCEHRDENGDGVCDDCREPMTYIAALMVDGTLYKEEKYTFGQKSIHTAVPDKAGYTGEWMPYTLGIGGATITAKYTAITYYATFIADGRQVGEKVPFTVESASVTEPAVPAKEGFTGKWSAYTLAGGDITVYAEYTKNEIPDNPDNPDTPDNPTAKAVINTAAAITIDYRTKVKITATATGLDPDYHLVMTVNGKTVSGNNSEVTYDHGELKGDLTYSVKIVDAGGRTQKDAHGNDLVKEGGKITCRAGFIQRLVAFFKGLFNLLPEKNVKP